GQEGPGREVGGAAAAPAGAPAGVDHDQVYGPHQYRKKHFGIEEVYPPELRLGHDRACDQSERHEGETEKQRAVADFFNYLECRQARKYPAGILRLEAALLQKIHEASAKAEEQRRVSGEDQGKIVAKKRVAREGRGR